MTLILEVSKKEHLSVSLYAPGATVQSYERLAFDLPTITLASYAVMDLIQRNSLNRDPSFNVLQELKKNGQILFDYLIPLTIKQQLIAEKSMDLTLLLDESLVFIPWELLFDGQEFFCLRFNTGRRVKMNDAVRDNSHRSLRRPLIMQVIADPQGNLPWASKEAAMIRDKVSVSGDICMATKTKNVFKHFIQKNIKGYDILHYAGHADFDSRDHYKSGWRLCDGTLMCQDFIKLGESGPLPQLIFMNACQSVASPQAIADQGYERGLLGLAQAFLKSGARFVIGTVAKVVDNSAAEIASAFYSHLINKDCVGLALRKARQDLIRKIGAHDLTWALYVFYGDPSGSIFDPPIRDIALTKSPLASLSYVQTGRKLWGVIGVLILAGLGWFFAPYFLAWSHKKTAMHLAAVGKYQHASLKYQRALDYVSNDDQAVLGLYRSYIQLGRYKQAVVVMESFLSKNSEKSLGSRFVPLHFVLGQGYYLLNEYSLAYKVFSTLERESLSVHERLKVYELLANSAALADRFDLADQWYEKAIVLAGEVSAGAKKLQLLLARADHIYLVYDGADDQQRRELRAQEYYREVLHLAQDSNDNDLMARAFLGLAQISRMNKDWGLAQGYFQKASMHWGKIERSALDDIKMLGLANVHFELANLNIDPQLKFNEALTNFEQMAYWLTKARAFQNNSRTSQIIKGYSNELLSESIKILLRRSEILLRHLAQMGYQNSDYYRKAGQIYDQLHKILTNHPF